MQFYTPGNYLTNFRLLKLTYIKKNKNLCHGVSLGVGFYKSLLVKTHRRIDGMTKATCQEELNFDYFIYQNTKERISDQRLFSLI